MEYLADSWRSIWFSPRNTIRNIIETDPKYRIILLVILGGTAQILNNASVFSIGKQLSAPLILLLSLVFGPFGGFITLYIGSFFIQLTSRIFGGTAGLQEIRIAMAWSWVPLISVLPLWIIKFILFRDELFVQEKPFIDSQPVLSTLYDLITILEFMISLWSLVILYLAMSEANRFAAWKGFAAVLLAGLIMTIPLLLVLTFAHPV